jgi:TRAP-type mannitol/chloroaromatic compound transport system substrate-binding protein
MMASYDHKNPAALRSWWPAARSCGRSARKSCRPASTSVERDLCRDQATNAGFKKIFDSQAAFRKDAYLWAQIAEYTFDTFMMLQQRAGKL